MEVTSGSLVAVDWSVSLPDGTIADSRSDTLFRPGAHQVAPGVEDSVIGMKEGGCRLVRASSERIYSVVREGGEVGERSVVPKGVILWLRVCVKKVNPYG